LFTCEGNLLITSEWKIKSRGIFEHPFRRQAQEEGDNHDHKIKYFGSFKYQSKLIKEHGQLICGSAIGREFGSTSNNCQEGSAAIEFREIPEDIRARVRVSPLK